MHVELRLWVPGGQEQTGLCPTTLQSPPSIGQTVFEPEEHGSRQPPSTQAWVKLQPASRSHGRTRFSEAEADSPVSWANAVPRSRSSPDILFIFCFYCTPLPGPSGATMATGQNGCLKQGSMVVTRDHMAGPCPCSGDINARAAVGSCAIASPSRHTAWWPREGASKSQARATPDAKISPAAPRCAIWTLCCLSWRFLECHQQLARAAAASSVLQPVVGAHCRATPRTNQLRIS